MIEKITLHLDDANRFVPNEPIDCNDLNPKAMLLYAGAKCAGLTLLHILEKERIRPRRIEIHMSGELTTERVEAGSEFRSFNTIYNLEVSSERDQARVGRAVNLAHEKYCGTIRMLGKIAPVIHVVAVVNTAPAAV